MEQWWYSTGSAQFEPRRQKGVRGGGVAVLHSPCALFFAFWASGKPPGRKNGLLGGFPEAQETQKDRVWGVCTCAAKKATPTQSHGHTYLAMPTEPVIVVSLVNGRPGAMNFSYSPLLRNFTKATNIRLRFLRTNTLLGHLMGKALRDPTVTRRDNPQETVSSSPASGMNVYWVTLGQSLSSSPTSVTGLLL
ncbi:Laminin subunit alpha-5, partial [Ophiophagus hannah]